MRILAINDVSRVEKCSLAALCPFSLLAAWSAMCSPPPFFCAHDLNFERKLFPFLKKLNS